MANVKPIRTFLTTFLFIPFFSVSAQDISGIWQGVSYITGGTSYYVCTMTLQQNGPNVTGTALTKEVIPRGYYVIQSVAGTVSNNVFNFADQAVIERRDQSSFNWCMRSEEHTSELQSPC